MTEKHLRIAQLICRPLPPLIGQKARSLLYPYESGRADQLDYTTAAQTGSPFRGSTADFHSYPFAAQGYYNWRAWAVALAVCQRGDTIIEIGANVGTETVGFSDIVGRQGRVFAFEPSPHNCQAIRAWANESDNGNITLFQAAVSDRVGTLSFALPSDRSFSGIGHIATASTRNNTITVDTITLDSLAAALGRSALLFIDAEGSEYAILTGGKAYIEDCQPILMLEAVAAHLARFGVSLADLYTLVSALGYRVYRLARFGLIRLETPHEAPPRGDWVCIPNDASADLAARKIVRQIRLCGLMPCVKPLNPMCGRKEI